MLLFVSESAVADICGDGEVRGQKVGRRRRGEGIKGMNVGCSDSERIVCIA